MMRSQPMLDGRDLFQDMPDDLTLRRLGDFFRLGKFAWSKPRDPTAASDPLPVDPYALPLSEIAIELTSKCNLTCGMCSVWKGRRDGISAALVRELLAEAWQLGARSFVPCGAEIFMRKDTMGLLKAADDLGFERQEIVTNGILLPQHADALADIPSIRLHVSIDGPARIHDALRGEGNYDKALEGVRAVQDRGIPVELSAVLMRQTLETADHIVDLACELGIGRVSFQPFQPEIAGIGLDHSDWTFPRADQNRVEEELQNLVGYAARKGIEIFTASTFEHIVPYLFDVLRPIPKNGCYMPSRFVLIDGRGESYPCFFMRGRSMGNVTQGVRLREIWDGHGRRIMQDLALARKCPGCLAACSDIAMFDASG